MWRKIASLVTAAGSRLLGMGEFLFGRYHLIPDRRALLVGGSEIPVRSRPFDILVTLVEWRDRAVSKDELLERVWGGRIVEEGNLSVHIASLRKLLGAGFIATLPGRGYRFVAPVEEVVTPPSSATSARQADVGATRDEPAKPSTNLPAPVSQLIGRDGELAEVKSLLDAHRLVTLIGPGGIGKTRLALEVARHLLPQCADGVWLVDLAALSDGSLVLTAVASVLGIAATERGAMLDRIATALRSRTLLLVLDNCEHLLNPVASVAETVTRAGGGLRVLATSREPLKVEGEWLYRVPPLSIPAEDVRDTDDILNHSAVELFMSRTAAAGPHFGDHGPNAEVVGSICRRLDGIPLAIELAAARAATLGIEAMSVRLDDRFKLLTDGRRTALPRHQTLRATIDWSYELLTDSERAVLRRLGVFVGSFGFDAAVSVAALDEAHATDLTDVIGNLVAKSLIVVEMGGETTRYRLLETTRAYALEKLAECGESDLAARRHAEFYRDLFAPSEPAAELKPTIQRINLYVREIDNVRTALDWAFSPGGDVAVGVVLTAAYVPVWLYLSLVGECRERAERALNSLGPGSDLSSHLRIQLYTTLGVALVYTIGIVERTATILAKALEIAESLDDVDAQLQVRWAMWIYRFNNGEIRVARGLAKQFLRIARRAEDPVDIAGGYRLLGSTLHYEGDQSEARRCLERAVDVDISSDQRHLMWFHYDHGVMVRARSARVLLMQGLVDQAEKAGQAALGAAQRINHKLSICFALGETVCPLALMVGDLTAAERALTMLVDVATRHNFSFWSRLASCLEGSLLIRRGDITDGISLLRAGLDAFIRTGQRLYISGFIADLAQGLAESGHADEADTIIDDAVSRSDADGVRWHVPELLRVKGELMPLNLKGESLKSESMAAAERCFVGAIEEASRQGALFWELRSSVSLANLRIRQDRREDGQQLLVPVYRRFTEGFATADLIAARTILQRSRRRPDGTQ
jgi:predicted ATPase/DNA-binding winged helix-turn-helix (wHTH) protein